MKRTASILFLSSTYIHFASLHHPSLIKFFLSLSTNAIRRGPSRWVLPELEKLSLVFISLLHIKYVVISFKSSFLESLKIHDNLCYWQSISVRLNNRFTILNTHSDKIVVLSILMAILALTNWRDFKRHNRAGIISSYVLLW